MQINFFLLLIINKKIYCNFLKEFNELNAARIVCLYIGYKEIVAIRSKLCLITFNVI